MFKTLSIFLFSLFIGLSAQAELSKQELCAKVAEAAFFGALVKGQGMPKDVFKKAIDEAQGNMMKEKFYTEREIAAQRKAIEHGFKTGGDPQKVGDAVFTACLKAKQA